jgi:putative selenate reductase
MAQLTPYPLAALAARMFRELERRQAIFDLPAHGFYGGDAERDFAVAFHGRRVPTPLGPASGPHTQMAQNLVLSWLGGGRVLELKTVQVQDRLTLPRPCIDMRTVGFNAEWSQELRLAESLAEYVKGAMLIEMLRASGKLPLRDGFAPVVYDLSLGYDLQGIQSPAVQAFVRGMMDARPSVERLRRQIPRRLGALRDLDFPTRLARSVTLSTFHGCPPEEIERIADFLLRELGLDCVIKFNPTLLGRAEVLHLLHEILGYRDLRVPERAFAADTSWEQAVDLVERLQATAARLGLGFGVKLTNTLIVENTTGFLPASAAEVYLSGPPLHLLAMHLVRRFRRTFGDRVPISFSAGIDRWNFAEAVALGLAPITVCTDLLKPGGYGRLRAYHARLAERFAAARACDVPTFVLKAYGQALPALADCGLGPADPLFERCRRGLVEGGDLRRIAGEELHARWVAAAKLLNTEAYLERASADPRYRHERNARAPRGVDRRLQLFDCLACDLCVPVCPNDANFAYGEGAAEIPVVKLERQGDTWRWRREAPLVLKQRHQIGTFADFCNDCGNCDVFCPELGEPYRLKARFFGRAADWRRQRHLDGFHLARRRGRDVVLGRFAGRGYRLEVEAGRCRFSGDGFRLRFAAADPRATLAGEGPAEIDLTYFFIMDYLRQALLAGRQVNYVNSLAEVAT